MMKENLLQALKESMKQGDKIRKDTIQSIRASILQEEKDKQIELTDKQIEAIIAREKKKRIEALEQFSKANRQDLVEQTEREISIISEYLPEQLSSEEVELEVAKIINEVDAQSIKDLGIVMRTAKQKLGNTVDGKTLSDIVKNKLNNL